MLQTVRGDEALVISQLAQDWGLRERQSDRPVATPHRRTKIFSVFTRDCRTLCRPKSRIPSVPRESPLKRRPNEPTRAQNSAAVPFVPAMCFTFSLFASGRPFFFVLPSLFLHSFILSLPELSTRGRRKTHNSDSPSPSSLSLSHSVSPTSSFTLISIYVGASDPESGLSRLLAR